MNKIRNKLKGNFTTIPNEIINNKSISDRARFLFIYLASKPDDWNFINKDLCNNMGYSADTLKKYMDELVFNGWISRQTNPKVNGRYSYNTYTIWDNPITPDKKSLNSKNTEIEKTVPKNSVSEKYSSQKTMAHSNKYLNKKNINNKNLFKKGDNNLFI